MNDAVRVLERIATDNTCRLHKYIYDEYIYIFNKDRWAGGKKIFVAIQSNGMQTSDSVRLAHSASSTSALRSEATM